MGTPEQREVEELTRQAAAAPAMGRLRVVVDFVGSGRRATQGGNLRDRRLLQCGLAAR